MDTGTDLSIYTNIFGWYYYGLFIQLISSYGLWIIGFLVILWGATFSQASRNGRYDPRSSLLFAEYHIYLMLFILVFAVIPTIGVSTSFFHNGGKTAGNTDTGFDALATSAPAAIKIPAAWFIVWKLNGGITSIMRAALPNEDNLRKGLTEFQATFISDAKTATVAQKFNSYCHQPALASYNNMTRDYPDSPLLAKINADLETINPFASDRLSKNPQPLYDIYHQGNAGFMNHLYGGNVSFCTSAQDPNTTDCLPRGVGIDNNMVLENSLGFNNCNQWWGGPGGVETKVLQHVQGTDGYDYPAVEKVFTALGLTSDIAKRNIVHKGLNSVRKIETRSPYNEGTWNSLKEGVGAAGLSWVNWLAGFLNVMIVAFLPQLHAVMILLLLIMAPVISIIGLARPEAIVRLLLVAFIINLWIPIWIIVNWVDNVLLSLLYDNTGYIASTFDMGYVLTSLLSLSLYTAIPLLASFYIYTATANRIVGSMTGMAGAGGSAGAGAGMRGGAAASARGVAGAGRGAIGAAKVAPAVGRGAAAVGMGARVLTSRK